MSNDRDARVTDRNEAAEALQLKAALNEARSDAALLSKLRDVLVADRDFWRGMAKQFHDEQLPALDAMTAERDHWRALAEQTYPGKGKGP